MATSVRSEWKVSKVMYLPLQHEFQKILKLFHLKKIVSDFDENCYYSKLTFSNHKKSTFTDSLSATLF